MIIGLPPEPGPISPVPETWSISTNGVVCTISRIKVLTDVKDTHLPGLVIPVPHAGRGFTDMAMDGDVRVFSKTGKKGAVEEVARVDAAVSLPDMLKSWRINFDRLLGMVIGRLKKPTDTSPVVFVAFTEGFVNEITAAATGGDFWLAIPIVKSQPGVYCSDGTPAIGSDRNGNIFALSCALSSQWLDGTKQVLEPMQDRLAKALPLVRATAARLTRTLRHLGSLIGKSVETQVPDDW